eukprot:756482-Hanusia_phi.AAC.1
MYPSASQQRALDPPLPLSLFAERFQEKSCFMQRFTSSEAGQDQGQTPCCFLLLLLTRCPSQLKHRQLMLPA